MTMTVMTWVTVVTTAHIIVTQTRQTPTTMEKEMPVLWTLMEMVRTGNLIRKLAFQNVHIYVSKVKIFV